MLATAAPGRAATSAGDHKPGVELSVKMCSTLRGCQSHPKLSILEWGGWDELLTTNLHFLGCLIQLKGPSPCGAPPRKHFTQVNSSHLKGWQLLGAARVSGCAKALGWTPLAKSVLAPMGSWGTGPGEEGPSAHPSCHSQASSASSGKAPAACRKSMKNQ